MKADMTKFRRNLLRSIRIAPPGVREKLIAHANAGFKEPNATAEQALADIGDVHVWVEDGDGEIHDYDNDHLAYLRCRYMNDLTDDRRYHALPAADARRVWKRVFRERVKPALERAEEVGVSMDDVLALCEKTVARSGVRAYVVAGRLIAQGKKAHIRVGSMGWRANGDDGRVWWEFG